MHGAVFYPYSTLRELSIPCRLSASNSLTETLNPVGGSNGESPLLKTVITALDLESNDIGRALAYKMRDKVMMFCRIASIIYFLNLVSLQIIL